uniref:DNA replication licensing factor MCM5 n=1 Tax=Gongylonema pulchrum TaxID=637853 RepID=A0A183E5E0_9BILA
LIIEHKQTVDLFREFLREYNVGGFGLVYRELLKRNCSLGKHYVEVSLDDLKGFNEEIANKMQQYPTRILAALEEAGKLTADEAMESAAKGIEIHDVQVTLQSNEVAASIRQLKVKIDQTAQLQRCPIDPYHIMPDKCYCIDYQTLKLQENPEDVPHGEMPRHMQLYCDRYLTDRVAPGNRVMIVGVYSIKRIFKKQRANDKTLSGIRTPYIRVLGIQVQTCGPGRVERREFTPEEEKFFKDLAKTPNIYELITKSIAPSIYGSEDIKKSIACLLFSGSRKRFPFQHLFSLFEKYKFEMEAFSVSNPERLPDGLTRRGDINILLLGDPGTAKSQLLKFVEKVAPIAVYTSGKGSSAAGLTASVNRDPASRTFIMEGGAMVLADGGIVCIDEFDKMREDDRVAIHEAMEQQTISIAKAGITTTLNSRCSVLAAANSVYGRWDDSKGDENIDFMPTILSRFDMIYIVKDTHDVLRDTVSSSSTESVTLKPLLYTYIAFCRATCAPRLSQTASEKLIHSYVRLRNPLVDAEHR